MATDIFSLRAMVGYRTSLSLSLEKFYLRYFFIFFAPNI